MSDPAIEAAQRAWKARTPRSEWRHALCANLHEVAAARQALRPIRDRYQEFLAGNGDFTLFVEDLEKLIFTTEELANE